MKAGKIKIELYGRQKVRAIQEEKKTPTDFISVKVNTPIGLIEVGALPDRLCFVRLGEYPISDLNERLTSISEYCLSHISPYSLLEDALRTLFYYFYLIELLELDSEYYSWRGKYIPEGTDFMRDVWTATVEIPFGSTVSYSELARWIGKPHAARAVGNALGRNPLPILIPCHRVIASDGGMGGYSGDLRAKKWLIEHEKNIIERAGHSSPTKG